MPWHQREGVWGKVVIVGTTWHRMRWWMMSSEAGLALRWRSKLQSSVDWQRRRRQVEQEMRLRCW